MLIEKNLAILFLFAFIFMIIIITIVAYNIYQDSPPQEQLGNTSKLATSINNAKNTVFIPKK
jgi:hypothetical protein